MQTSSSAKRTCSEFASATEWTATVLIPSSRQAKMIRRATSPRFAIRIFLNIQYRTEQAPPLHRRAARAPPLHRRAEQAPPLQRRAEQAPPLLCSDGEQAFAILDGLSVLDIDVHHFAIVLRVDFVHQFHRPDDAKDLALAHRRSNLDERGRPGFRRAIEGAHDWRLHHRELD